MIVAGVFALGVAYGIFATKRRVFPVPQISAAKRVLLARGAALTDGESRPAILTTDLLRLKKVVYNATNAADLKGFGGGLALVRGRVIGVDRTGRFFIYETPGAIRTMDLRLEMNEAALASYFRAKMTGGGFNDYVLHQFRVAGIAARERDGIVELFVSHDFWDSARSAKTFRVSRLAVRDVPALLEGRLAVEAGAWESIFESTPAIEFTLALPSPFRSDHAGGRIVFDPQGRLLVGIGDHRFDGVVAPEMASQDEAWTYGKIFRIDPATHAATIYARGVRNPQGLVFDRDGTLWETEHGPRGGDELNRIIEGENYGWPKVTYGTDAYSFTWPLNAHQGRHEGFAPPVFAWIPSIGISNLIQVQQSPAVWDGDLLVSSLLAGTLFRTRITAGRAVFAEAIRVGERVRDLIQMSDGGFLLWTDSAHVIELREAPEVAQALPVALTADEVRRGLGEALVQCGLCHVWDATASPGIAPNLQGVFGRRIAGSGFRYYSDALRAKAGKWDERALRDFLTDPQTFAPGSTMPDVTMDAATTDAVVAYLTRVK